MKALVRLLLLGLICLCHLSAARADSWASPTEEVYYSRDRRIRFTVTPRAITNQFAYFDEKVRGAEPAGQAADGNAQAIGILGVARGSRWTTRWAKPLINDVAPAEALVSPDGSYVVTFDDWHFVGTGDNVVVIYAQDGQLIRRLALKDLLPPEYVEALPRSTSSIWWAGKHHFSQAGTVLVLSVAIPSLSTEDEAKRFVNVPVRLADGELLNKGPHWDKAVAQARRVAAAKRADEAQALRDFISPLVAPASHEESDWHQYLREAFYRLDPEWSDDTPLTVVLRSPAAPDYLPSVGWLREALNGQPFRSPAVMIASTASVENLVSAIEKIGRTIKPAALAGTRIYVAAPNRYRERIASALAPSDATVIHLDPEKPIAQRKERVRQREASEGAEPR